MNHPVREKERGSMRATLARLLGYFRPYRRQVVFMFVFSILGVLLMIIGPRILGEGTNLIFAGLMQDDQGNVTGANIDFTALEQILALLVVIYGFSALFTYLQQRVTASLSQNTIRDLRRQVDQKIQVLPLNYYDTHTHGEILSRTTTDIEQISTTLQQLLTQVINAAFTVIGIIIMMFSISWQMTCIALLVVPVAAFLCGLIIRRSQKYYLGQQEELGTVNSFVEEQYTGHLLIRLYETEDRTESVFNEMNDKLGTNAARAQFASSVMQPVTNLVGNLGYVGVCILGGILTANDTLTVGGIQAFIQYMQQFTQPIVQTANVLNLAQSSIAAANRVFSLLDEPDLPPEREHLDHIGTADGNIEFSHVQFGYLPDQLLIHDLNCTIRHGQKVGICGPTGAGKSTLINLLMRFYEISGGSIQIDGIDTRDISRDNLRSLFGMVLQDTWLYAGSIADNIRYGRPDATLEEVRDACRMANADGFIEALPGGYATILDEDASNFSAGQKQLLTIARAFCAQPQMLILDEATSSVDTRTEQMIAEAMTRLSAGKTNFQIAHRLSTIRDADLILVMEAGDIVEQGTHEELMREGGVYAQLYNSQFA